MEKEKNIMIMVYQNLKEYMSMEKDMEMERNIIKIKKQNMKLKMEMEN